MEFLKIADTEYRPIQTKFALERRYRVFSEDRGIHDGSPVQAGPYRQQTGSVTISNQTATEGLYQGHDRKTDAQKQLVRDLVMA